MELPAQEFWQLPAQLPSQEPTQLPLHPSRHLAEQEDSQENSQFSDSLTVERAIMGEFANMIAHRIRSTPFAAFLKNSLLDRSPSFFTFFFITLEVKDAYELPKSA